MPITFTHRVTAWQKASQPVAATDRFEWSDVDLFVVHYAGVANTPDGDPTDGTMPTWLRNTQNYYLTHPDRGYSLGYNVAVDWRGESWEIRGERFECAANKYVNGRSFAAILVTDGQDKASPAAVAEVNRLIREANASAPKGVKVLGHYQTTIRPYRDTSTPGTDCPGKGIKAQLATGEIALKTPPQPSPSPGGFLMALTDQQQRDVHDRIMGSLPGAFSEEQRDGAVSGRRRFVLDDQDGGHLAGKLDEVLGLLRDFKNRVTALEDHVAELVKVQRGPT